MSKLIAVLNLTIDGFCDHDAVEPDAEVHDHYTNLLKKGEAILYGRKTYELMKFWKPFLENPSEDRSMNDFALAIDGIEKIVFSNTLTSVDWKSAKLAIGSLEETVLSLKKERKDDILVGSRSLINQLMRLKLIDEYQLCFHPVIAGGGLPLFDENHDRQVLNLLTSKTFKEGAIVHYYQPR